VIGSLKYTEDANIPNRTHPNATSVVFEFVSSRSSSMESREASTISFAPKVLSNSVGEEVLLLLFLFPWFSGEESTAATVVAAFVALSLSSSRESNIALFRVKSLLVLLLLPLLLLLLILSLCPIAFVFVVSVTVLALIIAVIVIVRRPLPCRRDPGQNKVSLDFANDDDGDDEACVTTTPSSSSLLFDDGDDVLLRFNEAWFEKEQLFFAFVFLLLVEDKDEEHEPRTVGIDIDDIVVVICAKEYTFYWNSDEIWIVSMLRKKSACV
jgi:hypothetical protein